MIDDRPEPDSEAAQAAAITDTDRTRISARRPPVRTVPFIAAMTSAAVATQHPAAQAAPIRNARPASTSGGPLRYAQERIVRSPLCSRASVYRSTARRQRLEISPGAPGYARLGKITRPHAKNASRPPPQSCVGKCRQARLAAPPSSCRSASAKKPR